MEPERSQAFLEPEPRTWPMVIGVGGALWGGIGVVNASLAILGFAQDAQPEVMRSGLGVALHAVSALLSLALLVGGVQLARRRVSGLNLMRAWAPLSALVQGVLIVLMVTHREQFEGSFRDAMERQVEMRAEKSGQGAPELPKGMEKIMYALGLGCSGFAAIVPPGLVASFLFGRPGREAEAEWSAPAGA